MQIGVEFQVKNARKYAFLATFLNIEWTTAIGVSFFDRKTIFAGAENQKNSDYFAVLFPKKWWKQLKIDQNRCRLQESEAICLAIVRN